MKCCPIPVSYTDEYFGMVPGDQTIEDWNAAARAVVTPEMQAGVAATSMQALERVADSIVCRDPSTRPAEDPEVAHVKFIHSLSKSALEAEIAKVTKHHRPAYASAIELDYRRINRLSSRGLQEEIERRRKRTPAQLEKMGRIQQIADRLGSDKICSALAALHQFDRLPLPVIYNAVAEKLVEAGVDDSLFVALEYWVNDSLVNFRERQAERPARRIYDIDQYKRMAEHILREQSCSSLTAINERKFYEDGSEVSLAMVNAFISQFLDSCVIWDLRQPPRQVTPNMRMIDEVRSAMAHLLLAAGRVPAMNDPAPTARTGLPAIGPPPATPFDIFAAQLELVPDSWTPNAKLLSAYQESCLAHGFTPEADVPFFKQLRAWGGSSIKASKPRKSNGREPGYRGVRLRSAGL